MTVPESSINRVEVNVRTDGSSIVNYYTGSSGSIPAGHSVDTNADGQVDECKDRSHYKRGSTAEPSRDFQNYVCRRHQEFVNQAKRFANQAEFTEGSLKPGKPSQSYVYDRLRGTKPGYISEPAEYFDPSGPIKEVGVRKHTKEAGNTDMFDPKTQTEVVYKKGSHNMSGDQGFTRAYTVEATIKKN